MHGGRRAVAALAALAAALLPLVGPAASRGGTAHAALPDMRIVVPTNRISIGLDGGGHRELRFTHITSDYGPGAFEIDPHYDARTGVSSFSQTLYTRGGKVAKRVPLATYGTWEPPSDYRFPLSSFTLNTIAPGGGVGSVVARSPKVDYCITGDTQAPGYPNPPAQTFIPTYNCAEPTMPLGWSAGWGDAYDEVDAGQPISLQGVADGTYILRATVDPEHVLREVTTGNDVTDTKLQIAGDNVTVLSQRIEEVPLPRVRLAGVHSGEDVAGRVALQARVSPPAGRKVGSVQFLLDGRPLGPALTAPPYTYGWTVAAKAGIHYLSARVSDSDGVMGSAPVVRVVVPKALPVHVIRLRWHGGVLALRLSSPPRGEQAAIVVPTLSNRRVLVRRGRLEVRCPRPRSVTLMLLRDGHVLSRLVLPLDARPSVSLVNPGPHETVSGIVPVAAEASDAVGVTSVRFLVDGKRLGPARYSAPYRAHWDTRKLKDGRHVLAARVVDAVGHVDMTRVAVQVSNPAPPMTCFVLQHHESVHGADSVSTSSFDTALAGETLLAFVSADGPAGGGQTATVSGGGLDWKLVVRENSNPGDSEIWEAIAPTATTVTPITATLGSGGYDVSLNVIAEEGADGVGASARGHGASGAPHVKLRTLASTSLVFAVGNDWDRATARTLPVGWVLLDQWLNTGSGDTYWTQYRNTTTGKAGSRVKVRDTAPTNDHWNLAAVELVNSGD
jgi:Big-like domain-containing protein/lysyl oxidase